MIRPGTQYMKPIRVHTGNLKIFNSDLAAQVAKETSVLSDSWNMISLMELSESVRLALLDALPFLSKMRDPNDALANNEDYNRIVLDQATKEGKVKQDNEAGLARLREWATTGLLADTPENAKAIEDWLTTNAKGYLNVTNVDAAIQILRGENKLTFRKPAPPVVVAEQPKVELLPNGEPQLPLNASASEMRRASIEQLKDLSRRRGEGQRNHGFAAKF